MAHRTTQPVLFGVNLAVPLLHRRSGNINREWVSNAARGTLGVFPVFNRGQDAFKRRAQMRNAFATTSVVALLLAGPALAQAPTTNSTAPAGNGPEIIVKQPPPVITVQPHAPNVTVMPGK